MPSIQSCLLVRFLCLTGTVMNICHILPTLYLNAK